MELTIGAVPLTVLTAEPVEIVNVRVAAIGTRTQLAFPKVAAGAGAPKPARVRRR